MTVQGEILDMACYVAHEAKGPDHAGCASSRCQCQPDATLVLHVGTSQQREVDIVQEGIPLPIRPGEVATS